MNFRFSEVLYVSTLFHIYNISLMQLHSMNMTELSEGVEGEASND